MARNSHAVDLKTRTMPVELDFDNASGKLQPGTFSEIHWPVKRPNALFVPATAVASNLERTFVVRIKNNKTEWVDVKQGASNGKLVEVYGELAPGDTIAARGTDELAAGTTVTTKPADVK